MYAIAYVLCLDRYEPVITALELLYYLDRLSVALK